MSRGKQMGTLLLQRKIQYELCACHLHLWLLVFSEMLVYWVGRAERHQKGSSTSNVHEWGSWEQLAKLTTLW